MMEQRGTAGKSKPRKAGRGKETYLLLVAALITAIVLSGCSGILGGGSKGNGIETDVHKGTEGLIVDFAQNNPPKTLTKGSPFLIELEMRNSGATDIENGLIKLINVFPRYLSFPDAQTYEFDLAGKSIGNREGGYYTYPFEAESTGLPTGMSKETFWIKARACYPYETFASIPVCIDPNANNPLVRSNRDCEVKDVQVKGGQGAPVAITVVETRMVKVASGNAQMQFLLHIENVGKGTVTAPERALDECSTGGSAVSESDFKNIDYEATISGVDITQSCRKPVIDADDPKTVLLLCSYELSPQAGALVTPLLVRLRYGYVTEDVQRAIIVEDVPYQDELATCPIDQCRLKSSNGDECDDYGGVESTMACLSPAETCCKRVGGEG